jgi:hydroxymethylpyrimidine pyrophosphatase-like HAD family hydrolase
VKAVIALDLDQTMVFSERSAGDLTGIDTIWVEDYQDAPLSLMTVTAHAALAELSERHHVVPVTTRTPEQFGRIRLPGRKGFAVCCNGGILLDAGARDREWDDRVAKELAVVAPAAEAAGLFGHVAGQEWVKTVRQVEDLFVYLVAHTRESIPVEWVTATAAWGAAHDWTLSVQGRKAYLVPDPLSKGAAAQRVADLLGGPLLAAGDSLLDRDLLETAVYAARPAHGELHALDHRTDHLLVTQHSGARAADEILAALAERADALT